MLTGASLPIPGISRFTAAIVGSRASEGASRGPVGAVVSAACTIVDGGAGGPSAVESSIAGTAEGSRPCRGAGGIQRAIVGPIGAVVDG